MSETQRDIEEALFGSLGGALDIIVGLVTLVVTPILYVVGRFSKRGRR